MEQLSFTTLFEDDAILAVSKPSGIPSHSQSDPNQLTVESFLKKTRSDLPHLHLLHRLDTGTSGVLLFAKSSEIYLLMRKKFALHEIQKFYCAWSEGVHERKEKTGGASSLDTSLTHFPYTIDVPIAHHPKSKKRMIALTPGKKLSHRGKPFAAHTIIHSQKNLRTTESPLYEFKIQIVTGVTHQIRVHLSYLGFPLVGDPIYLSAEERESNAQLGHRLGLHAEKVMFRLNEKDYVISDFLSAEQAIPSCF